MYTELRSQPPTLELNVYATLREIAEVIFGIPRPGSASFLKNKAFLNFPDSNIVAASVSSYGECSYRHISSKFSVLDYIFNMSYFSLL